MTAWNGEEDGYVTADRDTWVDAPRDEKSTMYDGLVTFEIPSEDWAKGFATAMNMAAKVVERMCYPTLVGDSLRKVAREIEAIWERRQHEKVSR